MQMANPVTILFSTLLWALPAMARDVLDGPVRAAVVKVLDGDTFVADAQLWPGQRLTVSVRIRGIDAPEMRSRCEAERMAARQAQRQLARLVASGDVALSRIGGGKYYGRVLADVTNGSGEDVAQMLLANGLVRPYGGRKRQDWCR